MVTSSDVLFCSTNRPKPDNFKSKNTTRKVANPHFEKAENRESLTFSLDKRPNIETLLG